LLKQERSKSLLNKQFPFPKEERISIRREIDLVFAEGNSFSSFPFRVVYFEKKPFSGSNVSILISVPKKRFKRAVKRNLIKRRIRESYRLHKDSLLKHLQTKDSGLLVAFIFVGNELCEYKVIESAMIKALNRLKEKCLTN
jgi:ribonuclease P protein component